MTEEEMIALLVQLGEELVQKFAKKYSVGRIEQITSHLETLKMLIGHVHDEAIREEIPERKDGVIQKMVLASSGAISLSDARDAVERGER